jgi:hypothetical protein
MTEVSESFEQRTWSAVDRLYEKMDHLATQVTQIREEQIRMSAVDHSGALERLQANVLKLEAKIVVLEAANIANSAKQSGVSTALDWVYKLGPWVAVVIIASNRSLLG